MYIIPGKPAAVNLGSVSMAKILFGRRGSGIRVSPESNRRADCNELSAPTYRRAIEEKSLVVGSERRKSEILAFYTRLTHQLEVNCLQFDAASSGDQSCEALPSSF